MNNIEFIEETHQYVLDGIVIPNVSQLTAFALNEQKTDIPERVLRLAGEFGTRVHEAVESYESLGTISLDVDSYITIGWIDLCKENNIQVELMENIVYTEDYAGRYDLLGRVNNKKALIDIKTNRNYPKEHLEVQMGLYVNAIGEDMDCYCAWYNKSKKIWEFKRVEKISMEKCKEIVYAYKNNLPSPLIKNELQEFEVYTPSEIEKIKTFYDLKDEIERIEKRAKENLLKITKEKDIKSFENDDFKITYTPETTKKSIDTDRLKEEGIYELYLKESKVKEQIRMTPKWRKNEK